MGLFNIDVTGLGGITDVLKMLIGLFPNAEQRDAALKRIQDFETTVANNQAATNAAEASNPSLFVSGWRPAVGWICVAGFAYSIFAPALHLPATDTNALIAMLSGMLGLGTMRTVEKMGGKTK
jgi:hypothetical protein